MVNKETDIRALGICHSVFGTAHQYASFLGATLNEVAFVNTGIDHCSWFPEFLVKGREAWELLEEMGLEEWLSKPAAEAKSDPTLRATLRSALQSDAWAARSGRFRRSGIGTCANSSRPSCKAWRTWNATVCVRTTIADRVKGNAAARARIERMVKGEEAPHFRAGDGRSGGTDDG